MLLNWLKPKTIIFGSLGLLVLDQTIKHGLIATSSDFIILNRGVALGLGNSLLSVVGLILLLLLFFLARPLVLNYWLAIVITASSNLLDRLLLKGVLDYIPFGFTRVNLADLWLCLIFLLMIGQTYLKKTT